MKNVSIRIVLELSGKMSQVQAQGHLVRHVSAQGKRGTDTHSEKEQLRPASQARSPGEFTKGKGGQSGVVG